tara:strand:+ start:701 stop:877 length:177 start_codon:yes stop_codon:yes gene_type:complete
MASFIFAAKWDGKANQLSSAHRHWKQIEVVHAAAVLNYDVEQKQDFSVRPVAAEQGEG